MPFWLSSYLVLLEFDSKERGEQYLNLLHGINFKLNPTDQLRTLVTSRPGPACTWRAFMQVWDSEMLACTYGNVRLSCFYRWTDKQTDCQVDERSERPIDRQTGKGTH